jgi:release factor glutamine methyltransferase
MAVCARLAQDRTPRVRPVLVRVPGVFAPISDSWLLAAAVREAVRPGARVLDVCTGSGVVGVSAALAGGDVTSLDVSRRALACAWLNARLNGTRLRVRRGDLLAPVAGERFHVIAANPPYVPAERDTLPSAGAARAWDAGRDGRAILDRLLAEAPPLLAPGGVLLLVHSDLIGEEATLERLDAAGLEAAVAVRRHGPLGPLMRERRDRGLLPPETDGEDVLVLRGRAAA